MKQYQLPRDFAEKWVKALRSGEYKQGEGQYYNPSIDCYCAIGVGYTANDIELSESGQTVVNNDYRVITGNIFDALMDLNDFDNKSFPEIADWIEANCQFV